MDENHNTLILGLGNDWLKDDGIGVRIVRDIYGRNVFQNIDFDYSEIGGLEIMERISGYDAVFFVDALKGKKYQCGEVRFFSPDNFEETLHLSHVHDVDFKTLLTLAPVLNVHIPAFIRVIGIAGEEFLVFGHELSATLENTYSSILLKIENYIRHELKNR